MVLDNFRSLFLDNGLYDVGYSGYDFTWCNFQQNGTVVEERLDHFCADTEWPSLFPTAVVLHIDSDVSDHLPILLKCSPPSNEKGPRKKIFMFENMWLTESSSTEVIATAWSSVSDPNPVENSVLRLNNCAAALAQWNQTTFGVVDQQIRKLEHQL